MYGNFPYGFRAKKIMVREAQYSFEINNDKRSVTRSGHFWTNNKCF
jgi:hypothetical protein